MKVLKKVGYLNLVCFFFLKERDEHIGLLREIANGASKVRKGYYG